MTTPQFKIDEDLPSEVADLFRTAGHDAATVRQQSMLGWPDDRLWDAIVSEGRCLVTADVGFADARRVVAAPAVGIVLLCVARESRRGYLNLVSDMLASVSVEHVPGSVVTETEDGIRIHQPKAER